MHVPMNIKFSTTFAWNISYIKKNSARYYHKCTGSRVNCQLFFQIVIKLRIPLQGFREVLKYQVSWKSVLWEPSCSMRMDGQTDRNDSANSRFSQLCVRF